MAQHALDEAQVVAAATELAKQIGFEAVTLTKTAAQLAIRPQSMYRYVKNTDDLKGKILAENMALLVNQLYEQLIGLSGEQALTQLMMTVAFSEYTQIMPHDFAGVAKYLHYDAVREQYNRLYEMIPRLLKSLISDADKIRRGTQLLADYMLGESVTSRNNENDDLTQRRADFSANIAQILAMLRN